MGWRIHERSASGSRWLEFEGLLDRGAAVALVACCRAVLPGKLVLRAATDVSNEAVEELLGLGLEVVAESPFLARWLESAGARSPRWDEQPAAHRTA